jgi:hypothetical protein
MQSVQCSLLERETRQLQTIETGRRNLSMQDKHTSGEKEQSDRQPTAEGLYAIFVWLFGSGCY